MRTLLNYYSRRIGSVVTHKVELLRVNAHVSARIDSGVVLRNAHKIHLGAKSWLKEGVIIDGRTDQSVGVSLAENVTIRSYSYLDAYGDSGHIRIGRNSGIGQYVYIGGNGGVIIGKDVMISGHTYIVSATHDMRLDLGIPYQNQGETRKPVIIKDNAWVAANCVVLNGVTIGENSIIGAGSVVTKDIPPNVLAVGCPAKPIRKLDEEQYE